MSAQPLSETSTNKAAKELFEYACRQLTNAKIEGREQDRERFFQLARAIENAFPDVQFLDAPASAEGEKSDLDPGSDEKELSVH